MTSMNTEPNPETNDVIFTATVTLDTLINAAKATGVDPSNLTDDQRYALMDRLEQALENAVEDFIFALEEDEFDL